MNLDNIFCPNIECPARGQLNEGNISVHSLTEKRCMCNVCETTFSITKGTLFYRLRTDPKIVMTVIVLLAFGCPLQAIVRAFGFDERTVKNWWNRAGTHCKELHEQRVASQQLDLQQVQADEIKAKIQGGSVWMAMSIMVPTRLWIGGVISRRRDKKLIQELANQISRMALCRPLLLAVDGLPSYINAFRRAFRVKLPRNGKKGRARLVSWPNIAIVRVIKDRKPDRFEIRREIVQGVEEMIERLRRITQKGEGVINTAYIERLNATFRQRLACLNRRSRHLAQQPFTLETGMIIVGCFYNFCEPHDSLRMKLSITETRYKWVKQTPAMAAGLANEVWSATQLLTERLPPPRWTPPKKRGRRSAAELALIERWCN